MNSYDLKKTAELKASNFSLFEKIAQKPMISIEIHSKSCEIDRFQTVNSFDL